MNLKNNAIGKYIKTASEIFQIHLPNVPLMGETS